MRTPSACASLIPLLSAAILPGDFVRALAFVPTGDWNADGTGDFAVGLPRDDAHGEDAGRVFVLSGRDGTVIRELHAGRARSGFGFSLAHGTDVDRDGKPDLVVASHRDGYRVGEHSGRVHVYSSAATEPVCVIEQPTEMKLGAAFACRVDVIADLDADGVRDLAIASGDWAVEFGDATSPLLVLGGKGGKLLRSYPFGTETRPCGVADVDGDGARDLLFEQSIGIRWTRPVLDAKGEFATLPNGGIERPRPIPLGDLDRDGREEVALVGHGSGDGTCEDVLVSSSRMARALYSVSGESLRRRAGVDALSGIDHLDVCGAPDVDGDGIGELFVLLPGAYRSLTRPEWKRMYLSVEPPLGATMRGYAELISSRDGSVLWTTLGSDGDPLGWLWLGYRIEDVCRVSDLDGDGLDDLVVTSAGATTSSETYEKNGACLSVLSSKTGDRIAAFEFRCGVPPVARFRPRSAENSKPK